jgi:hypothetical protein
MPTHGCLAQMLEQSTRLHEDGARNARSRAAKDRWASRSARAGKCSISDRTRIRREKKEDVKIFFVGANATPGDGHPGPRIRPATATFPVPPCAPSPIPPQCSASERYVAFWKERFRRIAAMSHPPSQSEVEASSLRGPAVKLRPPAALVVKSLTFSSVTTAECARYVCRTTVPSQAAEIDNMPLQVKCDRKTPCSHCQTSRLQCRTATRVAERRQRISVSGR